MKRKDYFKMLGVNEKDFMSMLKEYDFKCNAPVREEMRKRVKVLMPRPVDISLRTLQLAEDLGGLNPGETFTYPNAQGGVSTARVCSLYDLPEDMVNPHVYGFGGHMLVPFYVLELLRSYAKKNNVVLPFVSSGRESNKGIFKKLFDRKNGLICKSEYDSYYRVLDRMADHDWVYANYTECEDTDTQGNLIEMYNFAKSHSMKEITLILCTANPFYDNRLLHEWMLQLKDPKFAEIRINLVLAHCPLFITFNRISVPEARMGEFLLGYLSASLGPLPKDTITFDGVTQSAHPERYLGRGVAEANWADFYEPIVYFNNMGWNNYLEIIYNIPHEEAVADIILADLFASHSFSPRDYDYGVEGHIYRYQAFLGGAYSSLKHTSFLEYLKNTNPTPFFGEKQEPAQRPYTD